MSHTYAKPQGDVQMLMYDDKRALTGALSLIESNDKDLAVGDRHSLDGPAIGRFQIHQSAWDDINELRKKDGLPCFTYHSAYNPLASTEYAYYLLNAIRAEFIRCHGHPPAPELLYACWSLGPSTIKKIKGMRYIIPMQVLHDSIMCFPDPTKPTSCLTSLGYTSRMAKRKLDTGIRYSNLLTAHMTRVRLGHQPLFQ